MRKSISIGSKEEVQVRRNYDGFVDKKDYKRGGRFLPVEHSTYKAKLEAGLIEKPYPA